jgi:phosphoglycolate phosphatase
MSPPLIIFDLDGTLVDSAPDLVAALNIGLAREGLTPLPLAIGRRFVGGGGRVLLRRGLEASGRQVSDHRLEEMFAAFLSDYEGRLTEDTRFYPGVLGALDRLASAGYRFAICTNKFERLAKRLLEELGEVHRFATIVGQDTFPVAKPNGAVLRLTAERAGADPSRAIMVGDTSTDARAARDAGLPLILVDFGYAQEPVITLEPDVIIDHFDTLPDAIERLPSRGPDRTGQPRKTSPQV